jgi:FkbM family methyltransferase
MNWFKKVLFALFRNIIVKPFIGSGLGGNPFIASIYRAIAKLLVPSGKKLISINGYDMMARFGYGGVGIGLIFAGEYEPQTTAMFKKLIKLGMTVVDIGGNCGYFTLLASKLVGDDGVVWAFEPEPRNYADLMANLNLNKVKNVIPVNAAVSNSFGEASMFISDVELGECSLLPCRPFNKKTITVPTILLDKYVRGKVDFIKSDTEGNEIAVLLGAKKILGSNNGLKIILEYYPDGIRSAGYRAQDLWDLLSGYGFRHIALLNEQNRQTQVVSFDGIQAYADRWGSANVLCSKQRIMEVLQ